MLGTFDHEQTVEVMPSMIDDTASAVARMEPTREESAYVPVASVNSAGGENTNQPPQAHTNLTTTSTRAAEEMAIKKRDIWN